MDTFDVVFFSILFLFVATVNALVARATGRNAGNWFALGILCPPSLFAILLLPAVKRCVACAEEVRADARRCRYCGATL